MLILAILMQAASADECSVGPDVEISACWTAASQRADADMNRLWPQVMALARTADRAFRPTQHRAKPSAAADLLAAQRAWITYRDAECAIEADYAEGGSLENAILGECETRLTRERITKLKDIASGFREG